ncbi:MAG: hypothetical protein ABJC79_11185 [Acidimicrobiia bacterium]
MRIVLREFCGYRAGDKGDTSDVALFAYDDAGYDLIVREVTAARVKEHYGSLVRGEVVRYEAANVRALNFVLRGALGGGGPKSLRSDNLGKTLGGALVRMVIAVDDAVAERLARRPRPDVDWADAMIAVRTT